MIHALNCEVIAKDSIFFKNYESLEFLGDSVFEVFVLGNAYKLFEDTSVHTNPEIMNHLKILLLSNSFMVTKNDKLFFKYNYIFNYLGENYYTIRFAQIHNECESRSCRRS